jgi:Na+/H+ antiporter NhaD/arsenite permease-like protein
LTAAVAPATVLDVPTVLDMLKASKLSIPRPASVLGGVLAALLPAALLAQEAGEAAFISTTDPVSQAIVGVVIIGLFVLLAREAAHRVLIVMGSAAFLWMVSYFTPYKLVDFESALLSVDFNVILLLAGMMAVVGVLKTTGVFGWAVGHLLMRTRGSARLAARLVSYFTAFFSSLLDNVTTVIFVTPMSLGMARRIGLVPVAILLPMVVASNIGGTATLIGDPPNIMIGSGADLSFLEFIINLTAPVVVMMVVLQWYIAWYYRKEFAEADASIEEIAEEAVELTNPRLLRWMMVICAGILVGFLTHAATGMPPAVPAVVGAAAALIVQDVLYLKENRPTEHERSHGILEVIERDIEWPTLGFFLFLFIIVGAAVQTGLIGSIANGMAAVILEVRDGLDLGDNMTLLFAAVLICWISAILSAFIDNIPYVAVSIPIIQQLIPSLAGNTEVLWWALSLGACLGGNATVVGASANVTTIGLAEKQGTRISFRQYSHFAAPIAIGTVVIGSGYVATDIFIGRPGVYVIWWLAALGLLALEFSQNRRVIRRLGR